MAVGVVCSLVSTGVVLIRIVVSAGVVFMGIVGRGVLSVDAGVVLSVEGIIAGRSVVVAPVKSTVV